MGINTVPHPPYSPDLTPCNFCLFPNLRDCRYETIEEMKEAVTKVIDTLTHGRTSMGPSRSCWNGTTTVSQLEEITSRGQEFHVCTINKNAHTKKVRKLI